MKKFNANLVKFNLLVLLILALTCLASAQSCQYMESQPYQVQTSVLYIDNQPVPDPVHIENFVHLKGREVQLLTYQYTDSFDLVSQISAPIKVKVQYIIGGARKEQTVDIGPYSFKTISETYTAGYAQPLNINQSSVVFFFLDNNATQGRMENRTLQREVCKQCPAGSGLNCIDDGQRADSDVRCGSGMRNAGVCVIATPVPPLQPGVIGQPTPQVSNTPEVIGQATPQASVTPPPAAAGTQFVNPLVAGILTGLFLGAATWLLVQSWDNLVKKKREVISIWSVAILLAAFLAINEFRSLVFGVLIGCLVLAIAYVAAKLIKPWLAAELSRRKAGGDEFTGSGPDEQGPPPAGGEEPRQTKGKHEKWKDFIPEGNSDLMNKNMDEWKPSRRRSPLLDDDAPDLMNKNMDDWTPGIAKRKKPWWE